MTSTTTGGVVTGYRYDGDNKRIDRSTNGAVDTRYEWDTAGGLPELALERNAAGAVTRRWVQGPMGPAWMSIPTGAFTDPTTYVYHRDHLGSVTDLTTTAGASVARYSYEPFGAQLGADTPGAPLNPIRFAGEYLDPETQDYHLRARQYDPVTGRFGGTDPVTPPMVDQWVNPYAYVNNMPGVYVDPSGEDLWAHDDQRCRENGGMYCTAAYANAVSNLNTLSYGLAGLCTDYPNDARCQGGGMTLQELRDICDVALYVGLDVANPFKKVSLAAKGGKGIIDRVKQRLGGGKGSQAAKGGVAGIDDVLDAATTVRGRFGRTADPGAVHVRRDATTGAPTHYQVYGPDGLPLKRVDLTGRAHGGVPTPHVVEYQRNVNPLTGEVFVRPSRSVRPANPDEIPGQ